jgi:hypothetical protein
MRLRSISVVLLGLLLTGVSTAWAQVGTTGTIQVILEDPQGGRLPGVTVAASANDVVTTRQAVSDAQGVATLEALAPSANYVVKAQLSGFRDLERTNILVRSGQVTTLRVELTLSTVTESVTVQGQTTPVVDVTRAVSGTDITLQLTESLPTGRSYQSYLQLVPGVLPDSSTLSGNPASRSGVNWSDVNTNGNLGVSTDNQYYFEGLNVTDPVTGTFGANLNTEIIQEQKVITGGIPAEYVGSAGLLSTVVTKSGTNDYHGSANYFFQNQNLVAENKHTASSDFSSNDTAFTIGGPIMRNSLWGFGSFRYLDDTRDVSSQDTRELLRTVKTTNKQGFAKGTWAPGTSDTLSFMFLNDPYNKDGSTDPTVPNNRDRVRKQGGNNYSGSYNRVMGSLLLEGALNYHDGEISDYASLRSARNTVVFQKSDLRTNADENLGGYGQDSIETRPVWTGKVSAQYAFGDHRVKGGFDFIQNERHRNLIFLGSPEPAQYTNLAAKYAGAGITAANVATGPWSALQFDVTNPSDFAGFISTINSLSNRSTFYNLYDSNRDGTITPEELGQSLQFSTPNSGLDGTVNYYRSWMSKEGPQDYKSSGYGFFAQDEFSLNRFTFNVGLRGDLTSHYATTGEKIYTFDWNLAPRLSAAYDILGDGRQKASVFWGRYFDPIRTDMTTFAGTASGSVREEQVFAAGQWVTYRVRGGAQSFDGYFSETTKTPYTDELQVQYEVDLGHNTSASATYYHRQTRDIFEDFDPALYTEPSVYPGPINDPNSLFLGWDYFGWTADNHPVANFYLGTLKGGERNYNGVELVLRRRFSDRWQGITSYSYVDAKGNAVSDGNADFAGDVLWLDPRAPNMYGTVPGTIHHLFKGGGSYTTKWGIEIGGGYRWNSGTVVNRTFLSSSRRLPFRVATPFEFAGITNQRWVAPDSVGAVKNPSWGQFDVRLQYIRPISKLTTEFFVDVFNLFNGQDATRVEDLVAGTGTTAFGDEITWVSPRRAFFGARVRF